MCGPAKGLNKSLAGRRRCELGTLSEAADRVAYPRPAPQEKLKTEKKKKNQKGPNIVLQDVSVVCGVGC